MTDISVYISCQRCGHNYDFCHDATPEIGADWHDGTICDNCGHNYYTITDVTHDGISIQDDGDDIDISTWTDPRQEATQ